MGAQFRFAPMSGMGMTSQYGNDYPGVQAEQRSISEQPQPEHYDDEAFAKAFEEAAKSERDAIEELRAQKGTEAGPDIMINESAERFMESGNLLEQERIGADLIHDPASDTQQDMQQDDPDALARTAAQLLESVKDNQSDKFQNSQFLELMRQLRDREVTVEGDKIVGTNQEDDQEAIKVATA